MSWYGPGYMDSPFHKWFGDLTGVNWYDDWYGGYDEKKYRSYQFFHALPFFSDYIDTNIATHKTEKYLDRYGLDFSDIRDPSSLYDSGNGSRTLHQLNYVSSNLHKLYR